MIFAILLGMDVLGKLKLLQVQYPALVYCSTTTPPYQRWYNCRPRVDDTPTSSHPPVRSMWQRPVKFRSHPLRR